ncbi:alanine racemase [Fulvivirga sp. RKSG066]|uniref:alanine racemase n=1 Tax=Fulvivirga aurantia TaxID=2529383 RepID=UPI0012BCB050|nr:alanine racemase [Fulvivirga aurantia]MTI19791.1 alanine racemase [Fulvivirga aurantia]
MRINEPTLILDEDRCKRNIEKIVDRANKAGVIFRPHFKTHQSTEIGEWFYKKGVRSITVSSLAMARYFADAGWEEITVAFPVNILKARAIDELAEQVRLNLLVSESAAIDFLQEEIRNPLHVYIEIDSGQHRSGLSYSNKDEIQRLIEKLKISDQVKLKGFYTHAGHTYGARSGREVNEIAAKAKTNFLALRDLEVVKNYAYDLEFCWGDTPSCSTWETYEGLDAISPGNLVFYDVMQYNIGACDLRDIAVALACPVVSKKEATGELIIHGGAIHFSKDYIEKDNVKQFGVPVDSNTWQPLSGGYVSALSQEHGIVKLQKEDFEKYKVGDVLFVLPVHSCLTAQAMGEYLTTSGKYIDHYAQKNRG